MKISGVILLDNIVEKLQKKHSVFPNEVEEIFANKPRFRFVEKGHRLGENVYFASGQTTAGRYTTTPLCIKKTNVH